MMPLAFSSARLSWNLRRISVSVNSRWANQAWVTMLSRSRSMPKNCGLSAITTTAFWTVERVTSAGRLMSSEESSCRVHDMPNSDVAASFSVFGRSNVKYEKSSSELGSCQFTWAPIDHREAGRWGGKLTHGLRRSRP